MEKCHPCLHQFIFKQIYIYVFFTPHYHFSNHFRLFFPIDLLALLQFQPPPPPPHQISLLKKLGWIYIRSMVSQWISTTLHKQAADFSSHLFSFLKFISPNNLIYIIFQHTKIKGIAFYTRTVQVAIFGYCDTYC